MHSYAKPIDTRRGRSGVCLLDRDSHSANWFRPFQGGLAEGQLRPLTPAARQLLDLIDGMEEEDAGAFYACDGARGACPVLTCR